MITKRSEYKIVKMNTHERESYQLKKAYQDALPNLEEAAERLQVAMGIEDGTFDDGGQLVVAPWHMPLPRELQGQPQEKPTQRLNEATDATTSELDITMIPHRQTHIGARPKRGRKRSRQSNHLERSLHNRNLAQHLSAVETEMSSASQSEDATLPPLIKSTKPPMSADEAMNKMIKRKITMVRIPPAPKDGPLSGEVPNLADQPVFQHYRRLTGRATSNVELRIKKGKAEYPKIAEFESNSDVSSPPRRRSMPPIEAVLAHGFKNVSLVCPVESMTPRSHAFHPWTNLTLSHKILSPTPAFLLNLSPFIVDGNSGIQYWKPSMPQILSHHLANPATLVEETPIQSLTFLLPPPEPILAASGNRRQVKQPHYKTEGPESGTEVRMIRMLLPPALEAETGSDEEVPHTDWLLFCLSSSASAAPTTRVLRSATFAPKDPYLLIAIPTYAIAETSAAEGVVGEQARKETYSTELKFILRGRLPLMFGVGRDTGFMDKWARAFGTGVASLEVEVKGGNLPCWL